LADQKARTLIRSDNYGSTWNDRMYGPGRNDRGGRRHG
jgi:hypothetical protein